MEKNNTEVIFKNCSPFDRRRVGGRRFLRDQEYLDHNPERRINMTNRRISGDRRGLLLDIKDTFREEDL